MAYEVQMECTQTQVLEQGEIGYRSGERLPVGHKDVDSTWRPVVVEVEDAHEKPAPKDTPSVPPAVTKQAVPKGS